MYDFRTFLLFADAFGVLVVEVSEIDAAGCNGATIRLADEFGSVRMMNRGTWILASSSVVDMLDASTLVTGAAPPPITVVSSPSPSPFSSSSSSSSSSFDRLE